MGMTKRFGLAAAVTAALLASGLSLPAAQAAPTAANECLPSSLTADQVGAIEYQLAAALQTAQGFKHMAALQSSSLPQKTGGIPVEQVVAQAELNAVSQYGGDLAGSITSAVLTGAEQQGIPAAAIGKGLAQAAAAEAASNSAVAVAIASTVAREGKSGEIAAFQATATTLGYANLAAIAGSPATLAAGQLACGPAPAPKAVVTDTGLVHERHFVSPWFPGGGGGGQTPGCLNPSCTKL